MQDAMPCRMPCCVCCRYTQRHVPGRQGAMHPNLDAWTDASSGQRTELVGTPLGMRGAVLALKGLGPSASGLPAKRQQLRQAQAFAPTCTWPYLAATCNGGYSSVYLFGLIFSFFCDAHAPIGHPPSLRANPHTPDQRSGWRAHLSIYVRLRARSRRDVLNSTEGPHRSGTRRSRTFLYTQWHRPCQAGSHRAHMLYVVPRVHVVCCMLHGLCTDHNALHGLGLIAHNHHVQVFQLVDALVAFAADRGSAARPDQGWLAGWLNAPCTAYSAVDSNAREWAVETFARGPHCFQRVQRILLGAPH